MFFRALKFARSKNMKMSDLKASMHVYSTAWSRKVEYSNAWTFLFFEFSKNRTNFPKNTKMSGIFTFILVLKDFLSNLKLMLRLVKSTTVNWKTWNRQIFICEELSSRVCVKSTLVNKCWLNTVKIKTLTKSFPTASNDLPKCS